MLLMNCGMRGAIPLESKLRGNSELEVRKLMRAEVLEETIRLELEQQAEKFGVSLYELPPNAQSWLRSLVIEQLYKKDAAPAITAETAEEE
jgi:hypothetical protein